MTKRLKLFLPLILFTVLAGFLWVGLKLDPKAIPSALLDKPWPAFSLPTLETGEIVSEKQLRGEKILVNVWATWCITCRIEHPFLMQLSQQGVLMAGVNYKDDSQAAKQWLTEKGNPFRFTVVDRDGKLELIANLGVFGAPETYFVDSQGVIRYKHVGDLNARVWQETLLPVWQGMQ